MEKPLKDLETAILMPCYKRPEYTSKALKALFDSFYLGKTSIYIWLDGANYWDHKEALEIIDNAKTHRPDLDINLRIETENIGLRMVIIKFFKEVKGNFDLLAKMDNDCIVPKDWMVKIISSFQGTDLDMLSPNVYPSNAAMKYGEDDVSKKGYRPTKLIGGLWAMKARLIDNQIFEEIDIQGIKGAIPILKQICVDEKPVIGWLPELVVQDIGHWSGEHPDNIKSVDHELYYREIGRNIAWGHTNLEEVCQ